MLYMKLWLQAFFKIYRNGTLYGAYFIMVRARKERSIKELTEFNALLDVINKIKVVEHE